MNDVEVELKKIILKYIKNSSSNINKNTNLINDLEFDSVILVQLIIDIEEEFKIVLDDSDLDFDNLIIFGALVDIVEKKQPMYQNCY